MQSNVERWLPVVGWEGLYEVSSWGRVKSLARGRANGPTGSLRQYPERIKKLVSSRNGYLYVTLYKNGVGTCRTVHSLVAEAFIGSRPKGMEVRHGSANRTDNQANKLCYGTPAENAADRDRDGTTAKGERNGNAKLTSEQVLYVRQQLENATRGTAARLARELGVNRSTIGCIKRCRTWADASGSLLNKVIVVPG